MQGCVLAACSTCGSKWVQLEMVRVPLELLHFALCVGCTSKPAEADPPSPQVLAPSAGGVQTPPQLLAPPVGGSRPPPHLLAFGAGGVHARSCR